MSGIICLTEQMFDTTNATRKTNSCATNSPPSVERSVPVEKTSFCKTNARRAGRGPYLPENTSFCKTNARRTGEGPYPPENTSFCKTNARRTVRGPYPPENTSFCKTNAGNGNPPAGAGPAARHEANHPATRLAHPPAPGHHLRRGDGRLLALVEIVVARPFFRMPDVGDRQHLVDDGNVPLQAQSR